MDGQVLERAAIARSIFAAFVHGIPARVLRPLRASTCLALTAVVVPIAQADSAYQCYVSTKDAGVQVTIVQGGSENEAKIAASQKFGARSFGMVGVTCQPVRGGEQILLKNPQLAKIPDWPQGTGVGEPTDCDKNGMQQSLDAMRTLGKTPYRCLDFEGKYGGQPWQSGGGETGLFHFVLHPNSPMVWRVYKRDQTHLIALVAEFGASGNLVYSQSARSPTNLLAGNAAPQPSPAQGQSEVGSARLPGETPQECLARVFPCLRLHAPNEPCRPTPSMGRACSGPQAPSPSPPVQPSPPKPGPRR